MLYYCLYFNLFSISLMSILYIIYSKNLTISLKFQSFRDKVVYNILSRYPINVCRVCRTFPFPFLILVIFAFHFLFISFYKCLSILLIISRNQTTFGFWCSHLHGCSLFLFCFYTNNLFFLWLSFTVLPVIYWDGYFIYYFSLFFFLIPCLRLHIFL